MKNIVITQVVHESSTFSNQMTVKENFINNLSWIGEEEAIRFHNEGYKDYLDGMIDQAEIEGDINLIHTFYAFATPSGRISDDCYKEIKENIFKKMDSLEEVDAVCLSLHGAGVVESIDDLEGDLIQEIREKVGESTPIAITLDLHANVTSKMVENTDMIFCIKEYPHTDTYEVGQKSINYLKQLINEKIRPEMSVKFIPIIIPLAKGNTYMGPMKEIRDRCVEIEANNEDVIECSVAHGFPFGDIGELGASVIVITDNNKKLADEICEDVYKLLWENREKFLNDIPSIKEGLDEALKRVEEGKKLIVINETADNPGAGTPGDGTFLLEELIKLKDIKICFASIRDTEVVQMAINSGIGSVIDIDLGGKTDKLHGDTLHLKDVYVKTITDGKIILKSPMQKGCIYNYGPSVRLVKDNIDIVVSSNAVQIMDEELFLLQGINVREYDLVCLKSSQHFKGYFKDITNEFITVDSKGLSTSNICNLQYEKVKRPIYPLDNM